MAQCACFFELFLLHSKKARKLGPKLKYLKKAYHHWSKNCHPDKYLNTEELGMANEAQRLINQAYITFCSYDGTYKYISSGKPPEEFPHECRAMQKVIEWVHEKVKIREEDSLGPSSKDSKTHSTHGSATDKKAEPSSISQTGKVSRVGGYNAESDHQTAKAKLSDPGAVAGDLSQLQVASSLRTPLGSLTSEEVSPAPPTPFTLSPEVININEEGPLDLSSPFVTEQTRRLSGQGRRRRSTEFVPRGYQIGGGRILFNKHGENGAMYLMEWHRKPGCTTWLNEHIIAEFFPIEAKDYLDRLKASNSRRLHTIIRKAGPICAFL